MGVAAAASILPDGVVFFEVAPGFHLGVRGEVYH